MILPPSVYQSIDKNEIEIGQGWLYSSLPIWTPTYAQELDQPVSVSAVGLSDLRFIGEKTTIVIREEPDSMSAVIWSGIAKLIDDPAGGGGPSDLPLHGELPGRAASDSHPISAVTDLATELAGKAALLHAPTHRVGGSDPLELTTADAEFAHVKHGFETVQATGLMPFTASYDNASRVLTLTPTGASFSWWWYGVEHVQVGPFSLPAHSATTGLYFASFDSAGAVTISTTTWEILNAVPIAIFDQNSVRGQAWVYPEWHTIEMDPLTHKYHHLTSGTRFVDGGAALSEYTYNVDSLAAVTFGVASAEIWDEDLRFQIPALADGGPYQIRYRTAPDAWIWDTASTVPYKVGATYITADIAGVQTQADGTGLGQYVNSYVLLIPGLNGPQTIILQGQGIFTTEADAQAESWTSLSKDGLPFQEFYAVWRVTYWARSSFTGVTGRVRMVSITPVSASASGSVGGSSVHNALSGRSDPDCHPTAAITGLDTALAGKAPAFISAGANLFWATPNAIPGTPSLRALSHSDLPPSAAAYLSDIADATGVLDAAPALAAFLATGKPLIVDAGTYFIGAQIPIPSGAHIVFQNGASFIQPSSTDYASGMLSVNAASNVTIENPVLVGSLVGTATGTAINDGIRVTGAQNVRIINPSCSGFQGNGIRVTGASSGASIRYPVCYSNKQNGILVANSPDCEIVSPVCYSNGTSSLEHGVYISGSSGAGSARTIISGIAKTYSNSGSGIQVNELSTDLVIGDVQTYNNGTNGINLTSGSGATEVSVTLGSVRSFGNTLRGFFLAQGVAPMRFSADKLCAYDNGSEGVYVEGITVGFGAALIDAYLNGKEGLRIKDNGGTAARDALIGSVRSWDNSQLGDGLYDGISVEIGIRHSIGALSVRSTNPALRHNYGVRVSGASQFCSFSSGEIYGSKVADFIDISTAQSSIFGRVVTGDNSFPLSHSIDISASSAVTLTGTLTDLLVSSTLPAGRYAVVAYARAFNTTGDGEIDVRISAGGSDRALSGQMSVRNSVRTSVTLPATFYMSATGTISLMASTLSGAASVAERRMTIVRL